MRGTKLRAWLFKTWVGHHWRGKIRGTPYNISRFSHKLDNMYQFVSHSFHKCWILWGIPFGYVSLEDNIWYKILSRDQNSYVFLRFQNLSFVCLIVFTAEFYVQFVLNMEDHTHNVEPVEYDLAAITLVLGTVIFCDVIICLCLHNWWLNWGICCDFAELAEWEKGRCEC